MFLKHRQNHNLIEVLNLEDLWDPFMTSLLGRYHAGEEMQDPENFAKTDLCFLSDEMLPQCWLDPHYHDREFTAGTYQRGKVS
jgi:hypothetical protein